MGFFGWYFTLKPLVRFLFALIPLGVSTALFFGADRIWPWGWGMGVIMLLCSFPTDGERNKWGDW